MARTDAVSLQAGGFYAASRGPDENVCVSTTNTLHSLTQTRWAGRGPPAEWHFGRLFAPISWQGRADYGNNSPEATVPCSPSRREGSSVSPVFWIGVEPLVRVILVTKLPGRARLWFRTEPLGEWLNRFVRASSCSGCGQSENLVKPDLHPLPITQQNWGHAAVNLADDDSSPHGPRR